MIVANKAVSILSDETWDRLRVSDGSLDLVNEVVQVELAPPAVSIDVVEDNARAWVVFVAENDARGKNSVVNLNVVQSDILDGNQLVRGAWCERVKQASGVVRRAGLVLLLRSNIDCPPDGIVDLEVVIEDVRDFTARAGEHRIGLAWIVLNIDRLERMVTLDVEELDVTHATIICMRDNRADSHTDTEPNVTVANNDVLRALGVDVLGIQGFDGDSVIIVGDVNALNQNILSCRVDSIGVQSVGWEHLRANAVESRGAKE